MACVAICAERASRVFTFPGQVALRIFVVELSRFKIFDNRVRADLANESGGERAAVQTLCEIRGAWPSRQRLDCGGFSTAFHHANSFFWPLDPACERARHLRLKPGCEPKPEQFSSTTDGHR